MFSVGSTTYTYAGRIVGGVFAALVAYGCFLSDKASTAWTAGNSPIVGFISTGNIDTLSWFVTHIKPSNVICTLYGPHVP
jgi:Flp pilus assembly pilin Flp